MMDCNTARQAVCVNETVFDSSVEIPLESDFMLPDYCPDIVKILKCLIHPCIKSCTPQGKQLCLEGVCSITVLYLGEDCAGRELRLRSIDCKLPYTKTIDLKAEAQKALVFDSDDSSYCNCRAVSKRRMELRAAVGHKICVVAASQQQAVTDTAQLEQTEGESPENQSGIQLRKKIAEQNAMIEQATECMDIREELELPKEKPAIRNLIFSRLCAVVSDDKLISGKIISKGELKISALYCPDSAEEQSAKPEQLEFVFPISGVIDAPEADDSCVCSVRYEVCEYELVPKSDGDGENTVLELRAQVLAKAMVYRKQQLTLADDCYSTRYICEGKKKNMGFLSLIDTVGQSCLYKGEAQLPDGVGNILIGWADTQQCPVRFVSENGEDKAVVQIHVNLCLLAQDEEGNVRFYDKTEQTECSFPLPKSDESASLLFLPRAEVTGFDYNRSGATAQLRCQIQVDGCICAMTRQNVLEDVTIDREKPIQREDDCSLTIYYADRGENLWEIAKRYHTGMSAVMEANAQAQLEENGDVSERQMLLIPILSE